MTTAGSSNLASGANQSQVRDHNERLLLSMIRKFGSMPAIDLARGARLSPQTVSVILRSLESDGLLKRGKPVKGKVGKPSVPMGLDASGAFSIGMKIGRRSADLALMDLHGKLRKQLRTTYRYPMPDEVFGFLRAGLAELQASLPKTMVQRLCGIGIGVPFEIWKWDEILSAPPQEFAAWRDVDFPKEVQQFSALPVLVINDTTAACHAENFFGVGAEYRDHAYFFVGSFIGGGVVLNGSVFEGRTGNAGALGSLQTVNARGQGVQLIDVASLHSLEAAVAEAGLDTLQMRNEAADWSAYSEQLTPWIAQAGREIAKAAVSACAVIDFEAVVIDGAFPAHVRQLLVEVARQQLTRLDVRGLILPKIVEGRVGENARVMGAAYGPIDSRYFLSAKPTPGAFAEAAG